MPFLPTTEQEMKALGWDRPDVILVTGDAYIDSPHVGVAVIGRWLEKHGFRTAIIAQPSSSDGRDITRLGEPRLFWGVSGGCVDSMVANHTALKKWRKQDDYTPGGVNARPNRAAMAYTNLIRRHFKETKPIVLGGIEASLRRVAHYDYWDDAVRRSVLFDAKADAIIYAMGEKTVLEFARALDEGRDWSRIRGLCRIAKEKPEGMSAHWAADCPRSSAERAEGKWIELPSYEEAAASKDVFWRMFETFALDAASETTGFVQKHGDRYLVHNPSQPPPRDAELDDIYSLPFERDAHPYYKTGEIRALETIRQSITTHRGCFGQCNFCAIAVHQGRQVTSRGEDSILEEVRRIAARPGFNGIIYDVGGPTANMYGYVCTKGGVPCRTKFCLMPQTCQKLAPGHARQIALLKRILQVPKVKKVFVSSGIRYDLVVSDAKGGPAYVEQLVEHHVSGQIKVAPEHYDNDVLSLMNKPSIKSLMRFKSMFDEACKRKDKRYFMTYYLMVAHPGCETEHMYKLRSFLQGGLRATPEQVQIFTPTPSTFSAAMYYCERDLSGKPIFVEKNPFGKDRQKSMIRGNRRHFTTIRFW
ncbi:MAG: YgiQ family radical SAM protein [Elusimicrobia bacterium]|nr:YgiQ family radical SAM protein [Elusimicrobiota bacterium]